jgi:hypothetical protein
MTQPPEPSPVITSFEEVAYYNMILVESLVQLRSEKGLLEREEIFARVKLIKAKTGINGNPKD